MGNLWGKASLPEAPSMFCYGIRLSTSLGCTQSELKWRSVQHLFVFQFKWKVFRDIAIFQKSWLSLEVVFSWVEFWFSSNYVRSAAALIHYSLFFFSYPFVCVSQDSAGRSSVREQHFTLEDDLTPSFGFVQSFILLTDHYILGRVAFIFMMLLNVGVLLAFRFLRVPSGRGELSLTPFQINIWSKYHIDYMLLKWTEADFTTTLFRLHVIKVSLLWHTVPFKCFDPLSYSREWVGPNSCLVLYRPMWLFLILFVLFLSAINRIDLPSMYVTPPGQ